MFLRNIRSTLVVALSIPISIISTFSLFYFAGFSLNTISLSGLALATGLIVDDAVVVLENIFRHIERDKRTSADAAIIGTAEISSAVLASTFTVMIVFFPLDDDPGTGRPNLYPVRLSRYLLHGCVLAGCDDRRSHALLQAH